jgi:hypothetical protein
LTMDVSQHGPVFRTRLGTGRRRIKDYIPIDAQV